MNNTQMRKFEELKKKMMMDLYGYSNRNEYEIKEARIEPLSCTGIASVTIVTGLKDDENTYGEFFRDRIHVFIGQRGGVTYYAKSSKGKGGLTEKRWNGSDVWNIYFEQKYDEKERREMSLPRDTIGF